MIFCNGESGRVNFCPGELILELLARIGEWHQNLSEKTEEFGYFPFEELPPVTTQVIGEVIECEIGNINIQHTDPVHVNTDISLPLKDEKLVKLQESDPHTQQLRKQWESNNLDKNWYTMENNILK